MTITEKQLAEKITAVYHEGSDLEAIMQNIARTAAELLGVELAPEPNPLPTEPGAVIIATEVRGAEGRWQMMLDDDEDWSSGERVRGHRWHRPNHITAWTPARVVPDVTAPVTLTEDMPDWDDVRNAVASQRGNGWSLNDAAINGITDAVMRLLHREEA